MIRCPICKFENFNKRDYCENCEHSISHINPESFHFAEFIKENSQIYSVIGILIAVSAYLISLNDTNTDSIVFFMILVVAYLVLFLLQKGYKIVKTCYLIKKNNYSHFLNLIHFYFYSFTHLVLIYAMFYYIPHNLRILIAAVLGFFIVLLFTLQNLSKGKKVNLFLAILFAAFLIEILVIQFLAIPFFTSIIDNGEFAFYYLWSIPVIFYFIVGGISAYLSLYVLSQFIIPDAVQTEEVTWSTWNNFAEENPKLNIFLGFIVLLAFILSPIIWQILTIHKI
jgi:hypothetical protein